MANSKLKRYALLLSVILLPLTLTYFLYTRFHSRRCDNYEPGLVEHLRSSREIDGRIFASHLGEEQDPCAVDALVAAYNNSDSYVRQLAIHGLTQSSFTQSKDPRAIATVTKALKDKDKNVRVEAATGLALIALLTNTSRNKNNEVMVEARIRLEDPRTIDALAATLDDGDYDVYRPAIEALGMIEDIRAVQVLIKALKHEDHNVVHLAKYRLKVIGPRATEILLNALDDNNEDIRSKTISTLPDIVPTELWSRAEERLIPLLEDKDQIIRSQAAIALGKFGNHQALEHLASLLKEDDEHIRSEAVIAMGNLARIGSGADGERALQLVLTTANDKDESVRSNAARALASIDDPRAENATYKILREVDWNSCAVAIYGSPEVQSLALSNEQFRANLNKRRFEIIAKHYTEIISDGDASMINELVDALNSRYGTKSMAEALVNCGNSELGYAARRWAGQHGYFIQTKSGNSIILWGRH